VDRNLGSVGDVVTWTVLVINNGPETATGVTIRDAAAAHARFVSLAVSQGTCANISCSIGTLPPGGTARIVARTRALQTGVTLNTVVVKGDQPDAIPENNVASALVRIVSAFRPPLEQRCGSLSVNRRLAVAGSRVRVRAVVKNVFRRPLVGTLVSAEGAGQQSAARTNLRGVAVLRLAPSRAGLVRITVSARMLTAAQAALCRSLLTVRRASGGGISGGQTGNHEKPHFTG
jgi:uncharacterized repeat protein (TIGR01451 family)